MLSQRRQRISVAATLPGWEHAVEISFLGTAGILVVSGSIVLKFHPKPFDQGHHRPSMTVGPAVSIGLLLETRHLADRKSWRMLTAHPVLSSRVLIPMSLN